MKTIFPKKPIILLVLLSLGVFSNMVVAKVVTSPTFNEPTIKSLEDKKVTVMKLAAAAAASATAISLIPGDIASPIANQIAQLSSYFILVLGAILLEKMLLAAVGYLSFTYIIPFTCFLGILYVFLKKGILLNLAIKLTLFVIILSIAIPTSVKVSDFIYNSYEGSINQNFDTVNQNNEFIDEKNKELSSEDQNWFEKLGNQISELASNIGVGMNEMIKKGEDTLTTFLDTIAILIVTSCVIPIVILMIFIWMIKMVFKIDFYGWLKVKRNGKVDCKEEIYMEIPSNINF